MKGGPTSALVAGEVREPAKNLGRTVVIGLAILFGLYVLAQAAVVRLLSPAAAAGSQRVFADAVEAGLGARAGAMVAALVVVSTLGSINGIVLTSSRVGFAMARNGVFPPWFGVVDPRFQTPARSILLLTVASLLYAFVANFQGLVAVFSLAVWFFYALTAVALLRLRRKRVGEPLAWRAPGGRVPPPGADRDGVGDDREPRAKRSVEGAGVGGCDGCGVRGVRRLAATAPPAPGQRVSRSICPTSSRTSSTRDSLT